MNGLSYTQLCSECKPLFLFSFLQLFSPSYSFIFLLCIFLCLFVCLLFFLLISLIHDLGMSTATKGLNLTLLIAIITTIFRQYFIIHVWEWKQCKRPLIHSHGMDKEAVIIGTNWHLVSQSPLSWLSLAQRKKAGKIRLHYSVHVHGGELLCR